MMLEASGCTATICLSVWPSEIVICLPSSVVKVARRSLSVHARSEVVVVKDKNIVRAFLFVSLVVASAVAQSSPSVGPTYGAAVDQRADAILHKMSLTQKIDLLGGEGFYIRAYPELGMKPLRMSDGPFGVRQGPATGFAAGMSLAASWDPELARRVGNAIGRDARARGIHFMLGPGVDIYRAPMCGRNFEYFGEDPYLGSRIAVGYIEGLQSQGVSATVKHYIANNQEFDRHNMDSVLDERTMREIYLPIFEAAVREAKTGALMTSYNLVNGSHATQNDFINHRVLDGDWEFKGINMSDWGATYDGVEAANGGLDLEMPYGEHMNRATLLPAIQQGIVSEATIDEHVRRILRTAIAFGWYSHDQSEDSYPLLNQEARKVALESALSSMVLLKNEQNLLPLDKNRTRRIAIFGPDAHPTPPVGGGSAKVQPFNSVSYLVGLSNYLSEHGGQILYDRGIPSQADLAKATDFTAEPQSRERGLRMEIFEGKELAGSPRFVTRQEHIHYDGENGPLTVPGIQQISVRWTGFYDAKEPGNYIIALGLLGEGYGARLWIDDKLVIDDWDIPKAALEHLTLPLRAGPHPVRMEYFSSGFDPSNYPTLAITRVESIVNSAVHRLASQADVAIVFVGFDPLTETEGSDRTFTLPPGQDELIATTLAANKNTIVVVTSGGNVDSSRWVDRVPAYIQAWYAGQEAGIAFPQILFGDVSPSGKLPVTFEHRWEDSSSYNSYYPQAPKTKEIKYSEGIFVGYRHFDKEAIKPLFPFGFGLSYARFAYSNLTVTPASTKLDSPVIVGFDLKNTGHVQAAEVAEVYVADSHSALPRPLKELKGFTKVSLKPGESRHIAVQLDKRAFQYYDVQGQQWRAEAGEFEISVGSSSAEMALRARLKLSETVTTPIRQR